MKTAEKWTIGISLANLALLLAGAIAVIVKFTAFDHTLLAIETATKTTEQKLKADELRRAETPVLVASLSPNRHQVEFARALDYTSFNLSFKNRGTAPVRLGTVELAVFESSPEPTLSSELIAHAARGIIPDSTLPATSQPISTGRIHSALTTDCRWVPVLGMDRTLAINYTLQPGQESSMPLDYIIEGSTQPKWYNIVVRIKPPTEDTKWDAQTVNAVVDIGPFPPHDGKRESAYTVAHVTDGESQPPSIPNAIPYDAIKTVPR